ncbi:MAG: T9SS type A sorting domain-containing protein, partial [Candidatus Cloacimonetes bacterium]|nr:T9SS type A sorting domain-containing protein [Candidatus Cloacimonadota bacterium]
PHPELVDATGRTVQVQELGQRAPGVHRDVVDIAGQPAGLYVLRIRNEAGETGTKRLIIR